jgi:large subunit ribosomal protein L21|uniref:Large ribosomal subunit protein bL21 n=1 Tax=Desulfomonile tiedjei TaxID=2358 RepID=A0A7C4EV41_9BACT
MYAIVQTGGKQYKVQPGERVKVERVQGDEGSQIQLSDVLAVSEESGLFVGNPFVPNVSVQATILRTDKDRKIIVFKKKRRKGYHKKQGHRQWYSLLRIDDIIRTADADPVAVESRPDADSDSLS